MSKHQIARFSLLEYPRDFASLWQLPKCAHTILLKINEIEKNTHTNVIERLFIIFEEKR